ncbi:hypothetical protein HDV00_008111 [Rhizophlyctis rosea]|nr:hypothetical protein HDV00_008111 [Rhizophlyctis rosea]
MSNTNTITILYFASAKSLTETASETLTLPLPSSSSSSSSTPPSSSISTSSQSSQTTTTVPALVYHILSLHPPLKTLIDNLMLAVNLEYVSLDGKDNKGNEVVIKGGDEVAFIPPVSGG